MDAWILDRKFEALCVVDAFESFIWTVRYREPGDFELYISMEKISLENVKKDYYIWIKNSDRLMIIEDIAVDTDAEVGSHMTITGRSLESLLERRVVFYRTLISGNLQDGLEDIFNDNAIRPHDSNRVIPGLRFIRSTDPRITELECEANLLGEDLLSITESFCELYDIGFKIIYNEKDSTFDFSLYYGEDRSYDQEKNPWVVFSPDYDNLLQSNYFESSRNLRTAAVVAGSENDQQGQEVLDVDLFPDAVGLDRRETLIEASDIERPEYTVNEESIRERLTAQKKDEEHIQSVIDSQKAIAEMQSRSAFRRQLRQRGLEELSKTSVEKSFEGQIEAIRQYIYGQDFFMGDVVQVRDMYGQEASSRITEIVWAHDVNGESVNPTFTSIATYLTKDDDAQN